MIVPVRELQIQNFRGIREASIELDPRVTVLFGSNAAGKTTVLDALAIGLGAITARVPRAKGREFAKTGDIRIPWRDRFALGGEPFGDEHSGVECPFARVGLRSAQGSQWDITKLRSEQDRPNVPSGRACAA